MKPTAPDERILQKFDLAKYFDIVVGKVPDGTGCGEAGARYRRPPEAVEGSGCGRVGDMPHRQTGKRQS